MEIKSIYDLPNDKLEEAVKKAEEKFESNPQIIKITKK